MNATSAPRNMPRVNEPTPHTAALVRTLEPFRIDPISVPESIHRDQRGLVLIRGIQYLNINECWYRIERSGEAWRVFRNSTARPGVTIDYDEGRDEWHVVATPTAGGGSDPNLPASRARDIDEWAARHGVSQQWVDKLLWASRDGLRHVDLKLSAVREIPRLLRAMTHLESLALRIGGASDIELQLTWLPESLCRLTLCGTDVRRLRLCGENREESTETPDANDVTRRTLELSECASLESIEFTEPAFGTVQLARLPSLRTVRSVSSGLHELRILGATQLEALDVSRSALEANFIYIESVDNLVDVRLGLTSMRSVPEPVFRAPRLRHLELDGTPLGAASTALLMPCTPVRPTSFDHLEYLDLSASCVSALPEDIGVRLKLETLVLARNEKLSDLPAAMCRLSQLRRLDLSDCNFREIPEVLGSMHDQLIVLVDGNPLLPSTLAQIESTNRVRPRSAVRGARVVDPRRLVVPDARDMVRFWRALASRDPAPEMDGLWVGLDARDEVRLFTKLLSDIGDSTEYQRGGVRARHAFVSSVNTLLDAIERDALLRDRVFAYASGVARRRYGPPLSLELVLLPVRVATLASGGPASLRSSLVLIRDAYRRQQLSAIAARESRRTATLGDRQHVREMWERTFVQTITTWLPLLGHPDPAMCAHIELVYEPHLKEVADRVLREEAAELASYAVDQPFWRDRLVAHFADEWTDTSWLASVDAGDCPEVRAGEDGADAGAGAVAGAGAGSEPVDPRRSWLLAKTTRLLEEAGMLQSPS